MDRTGERQIQDRRQQRYPRVGRYTGFFLRYTGLVQSWRVAAKENAEDRECSVHGQIPGPVQRCRWLSGIQEQFIIRIRGLSYLRESGDTCSEDIFGESRRSWAESDCCGLQGLRK